MKPQMSPCRSSAGALWSTSTSVVLHANAISLAATVKNSAEDNVSSDQFRLQFFNSIHCDRVCVVGVLEEDVAMAAPFILTLLFLRSTFIRDYIRG